MVEKFDEETSIHPSHDPQMWLEVTASDRLNKNQVYSLSIESTRELRKGRIVSTLDTSHSIPS